MKFKSLIISLSVILLVLTIGLTALFLSGKIIDIPDGSQEDGLVIGLGVVIIVITMINIGFIILIIAKKCEDRRVLRDKLS